MSSDGPIKAVPSENHIDNVKQGKVAKKSFSQVKPEKSGLLKRFFDWIAKGAAESNMGGKSCPT